MIKAASAIWLMFGNGKSPLTVRKTPDGVL
jgi:hypothetical protein